MILLAALLAASDPQVVESFDSIQGWSASASDGVDSVVTGVPGESGALRLAYDFHRVSGYAVARKAVPVDFPANYELRFRVRGDGEHTNDLQIKFVDSSGDNVWWVQEPDFRAGPGWQTIRIPRRSVSFAWGPVTDKTLRRTAFLEVVVVRGRSGGKGFVEIDELTLTPLADTPPAPAAPIASAPTVLDGNLATAAPVTAARPLMLDFGAPRELGGLVLHWRKPPRRFALEQGDGDGGWTSLVRRYENHGAADPISLGDAEFGKLRVTVPKGEAAELAEIEVKPVEWGESATAMVSALARSAPRGTYPRGFTEQSYWTLIGTDGGKESALIGEDGAVEIGKGRFSIEPFVETDGKRFGWAEVSAAQSLAEGYLPIPRVEWTAPGWTLGITAFAEPATQRLMVRYRVANRSAAPRKLRLSLAVRPFQINPPAQFLSQKGGVAAINRIRIDRSGLWVGADPKLPGDAADSRVIETPVEATAIVRADFNSTSFGAGAHLEDAPLDDPQGLGAAAILYDLDLAPGETRDIRIAVPLASAAGPAPAFDEAYAATAAYWRERLNPVRITVPSAYRRIPDTIRSATAQILMSRAGPMLKPGTRSYDRSWIRDGAMMADGLLRLGLDRPVADYADWYAGFLFDNGKVPCCVDYRGADPVPENDSHGEFIHLITQLYRYTGDRARLERQWPKLLAAQLHMESLRQSERRPGNPPWQYGLMPPSISHEGYSAKAQYSLWDDFWALRGYKDAAFAATALGKPEAADMARQRDEFRANLHAAIAAAAQHWKIDYIPGATSLGDLDATSTTMALDPAGEQSRLDPRLLAGTFERYWRDFTARRDGTRAWQDYTPYELRNVSAFVRLGWRARAGELLDFFFRDQRPQGWNQWAEVVGRDPREIRFIGDMPHAWVASDYVRSALDLFAYARDDGAIVLAAGLMPGMLEGEGAAIHGLRTPHGMLGYAISATPRRLTLTIEPGASPPGGFVLPWPLGGQSGAARIDGNPARFASDGLHIAATGTAIHVEVDRR